MGISVFTPVWGAKHLDLLEKALIKSLSWPKNKAEFQDAKWVIVSEHDHELEFASQIIKTLSPQIEILACKFPMISRLNSGMCLIDPLKFAIKHCLETKSPLLMATPDFIFGDGTISAFKNIAFEAGSCASIAHMRVLPYILGELDRPESNAHLMSLAFKYPHRTFTESPRNLNKCGMYKWDFGNIKAIQHYMPSPFYVNFLAEDLKHFEEFDNGLPPGFGMWDHVWPKHLIRSGRLRFIGSSDLACMVEVTDHDKNVAPLDKDGEHGFFRDNFHNEIQKQFISVFRGV